MDTAFTITEPVRYFYYDDEAAKSYYESEKALGAFHVWLAELYAVGLGQHLWFYTSPVWDSRYKYWKVWFVSSDYIPESSQEIILQDDRRYLAFVIPKSQKTHSV